MYDERAEVLIDYTNHRGERRWRRVKPFSIEHCMSAWHEGAQWIMHAVDTEKGAVREFAMTGIHAWRGQDDKQDNLPPAIARAVQDHKPSDEVDYKALLAKYMRAVESVHGDTFADAAVITQITPQEGAVLAILAAVYEREGA